MNVVVKVASSRMTNAFNILTVLYHLMIVVAKGDDPMDPGPEEIAAARSNYAAVFGNIPQLFEHIIDQLQDKPEILEKNDVSFVKRDTRDAMDSSSENNTKKSTNGGIVKRDININILYDLASYAERYGTKVDQKSSSDSFTNNWYLQQGAASKRADVYDEDEGQMVKRDTKDEAHDAYCKAKLNEVNEKLKSYVDAIMARSNNN